MAQWLVCVCVYAGARVRVSVSVCLCVACVRACVRACVCSRRAAVHLLRRKGAEGRKRASMSPECTESQTHCLFLWRKASTISRRMGHGRQLFRLRQPPPPPPQGRGRCSASLMRNTWGPRAKRSHVRCGGEPPPNCTVLQLPDCKVCQHRGQTGVIVETDIPRSLAKPKPPPVAHSPPPPPSRGMPPQNTTRCLKPVVPTGKSPPPSMADPLPHFTPPPLKKGWKAMAEQCNPRTYTTAAPHPPSTLSVRTPACTNPRTSSAFTATPPPPRSATTAS